MARKLVWGVALVAGLLAASIAALYSMRPQAQQSSMHTPAAEKATAVAPAVPPTEAPATTPRPGYDRYRAEIERIRSERRKAQALQANERCIEGQRYRKSGGAWEQAGHC